MRKSLFPLAALALLAAHLPAQFTQWVNPFVGTGGHGHTFPGPVMPFGMMQLSPDTRLDGWDGCSGYHFSDSVIYGFSHTHLSGTGVPDLCDVLLMPGAGAVIWDNGATSGPDKGYSSRFSKATEKARPGQYSVVLADDNIAVRLTATDRAGMHSYSWPHTAKAAHILLDLQHRDKTLESWVRVVNDTTVEGMRRSKAWAEDQAIHFVMHFSSPITGWELREDGAVSEGKRESHSTALQAAFRFDLARGREVRVKVGISAVDVEGARRNLAAEMPHWDLEGYMHQGEDKWNRQLAKVRVEGGSNAEIHTFYTALYHCMIHPSLFSDVDGRYRGRDNQIHQMPAGRNYYSIFSLWDTYRALHPLLTLLEPQRTRDFMETFLRQYQEGGRLPVWELHGNETDCMIGYHAVSVMADAWAKGYRETDPHLTLEAMMHSAREDRFGVGAFASQGYLQSSDVSESVSRALEYSYDDWCIAQMAASIGRREERDEFMRRAAAWRSHYDPATRFLRARTNGGWWEPFEPREVNFNFTEANAWQYSLAVPHDIPGLLRAHGGPANLRGHLDDLFSASTSTTGREQADITGLIGQYAHGNEPSHHMAYLYNFTDAPWRTRFFVRRILHEMYSPNPDGLSGNEDCGQMSAWYVFSALGLYPITPGDPTYALGSPLFKSATFFLENGQRFTISQNRENDRGDDIFLNALKLNGQSWPMLAVPHNVITRGGELQFYFTSRTDGEGKWLPVPAPELPHYPQPGTVTPAPVILAASRSFTNSLTVQMRCLSGNCDRLLLWNDATQHWDTLTASSFETTITQTSTFRLRAHQNGMSPSGEVQATFFRRDPSISILLSGSYAPEYAAGGKDALIDGIRGPADFRTGDWQGYREDFGAIVNLGKTRRITSVRLSCLQDQKSWIFMPTEVLIEVSRNGKKWEALGATQKPKTAPEKEGAVLEEIGPRGLDAKARYVRVSAKLLPAVPNWHIGAGGKPWIFVDEVVVE